MLASMWIRRTWNYILPMINFKIRKILEKSHGPIIVIGILTMVFMLSIPKQLFALILSSLMGIAGAILLAYPGYLFWYRRADFDWHLIHGHFLHKVIALVISVPFIITSLLQCNPSLTKEMIFDDNLYKQRLDTIKTVTHVAFGDSLDGKTVAYTSTIEDTTLPDSIRQKQADPPLLWAVYYHLIDPGNQHMTTTPLGRKLAALIAIIGVFLINGLLVTSLLGWIDRRKDEWKNGAVRYRVGQLGRHRFAVVIGANEIAASVIKNLFTPKKKGEINYKCEGNNDYVILQTSRNTDEVRDELASHLSREMLKKVIIYKALRDSDIELKNLHLTYATEIYVLGESTLSDGGESFHDSMNMRCINLIAENIQQEKQSLFKSSFFRALYIRYFFNQLQDRMVGSASSSGCSIWHQLIRNVEKTLKRKICKVMFEYQTTSSIFQFSDVTEVVKESLVFIPFNRYESWARAVIVDNSAVEDCSSAITRRIPYIPLDGDNGISENDDNHVHLVIVGMSKMGVAMGLQTMLQAHYPNFAKAETEENADQRQKLKNKLRTRITFIDTFADQEMAFFKGRYENLFKLTRYRYVDVNQCDKECLVADSEDYWIDHVKRPEGVWSHLSMDGDNFIDLEVEFLKGELESEGIRTYLRNISDKNNDWVKHSNLTVAICLTHTHQAIAASLYMPVSVYDKAQDVWVYQCESADIVMNLSNTALRDKRYKKLKPFGMLYGEYMSNRAQYLKALMVNGAYDLNKVNEQTKEKEVNRIDFARSETYSALRKSWKKLTIDKRFSNRNFVDSIPTKIRSLKAVGLSNQKLEHLIIGNDSLARCEHNRWNVQQLLFGYSPCDKSKDDELRELNERCIAASRNHMGKERENLQKALKEKKNEWKESEDRLHPNICSHDHLDAVDSGAKSYDATLNGIIPIIKEKVDDKIREQSEV